MTSRKYLIWSLLAIIVPLFVVMMVYLLIRIHETSVQKRLVQEIRKQGGEVRYAHEYIRSVPPPSRTLTQIFGIDFCAYPTEISFFKKTANDNIMRAVGGLQHLEDLYLDDNPISDAGLEHISSLRELRQLSLCGTKVSDTGMKSLSGLSKLRYLSLDQTNISDAGLAAIEGIPKLRILNVCKTRVTEAGLARLQNLEVLTVSIYHNGGLDGAKLRQAQPYSHIFGVDEKGNSTVIRKQ